MCCTVTPGGGPNLRVGEVLPAMVPSAAKGELTDSDRSGEFTSGEDIFTAKMCHRINSQLKTVPSPTRHAAVLFLGPSSLQMSSMANLRSSVLHPNNTPVPTEYQKESFEAKTDAWSSSKLRLSPAILESQ